MNLDEKLDPRIIPLVEELNRFPGVETFASCGGHRHVHLKGFHQDDSNVRVGPSSGLLREFHDRPPLQKRVFPCGSSRGLPMKHPQGLMSDMARSS